MLATLPDTPMERRKLLTTRTKLKEWTEKSKQDVHLLLTLVRLIAVRVSVPDAIT